MQKRYLALEITQWVIADLSLTLPCEFSYDPQDPLAVAVVFDTDGESPVRWFFSRELLADGLAGRSGEGDVVIWPVYDADGEPDTFCVRVGNAHKALFEIPVEPVAAWLAETYALVARGSELDGVDWDELALLAE